MPAARRRRWLAVAIAGAGVLLAVAATGAGGGAGSGGTSSGGAGSGGASSGGEREQRLPLVYLSGLDDHLLPARDTVPLHREPDGPVIAQAPTDTLAWVHDQAGEWLEVTLAEGEPGRGWIADFHLRGELHAVDPSAPACPVPAAGGPGDPPHHQLDPSARVRLLDLAGHGPAARVLVQRVDGGTGWWVERRALSERPGPDIRQAGPGPACEEIILEPVDPHTH